MGSIIFTLFHQKSSNTPRIPLLDFRANWVISAKRGLPHSLLFQRVKLPSPHASSKWRRAPHWWCNSWEVPCSSPHPPLWYQWSFFNLFGRTRSPLLFFSELVPFFMRKLVKLPISKCFRIPFLVEFNYVFVVLFLFFFLFWGAFSRKYPTRALSHINYENIRLSNKEGGAVLGWGVLALLRALGSGAVKAFWVLPFCLLGVWIAGFRLCFWKN